MSRFLTRKIATSIKPCFTRSFATAQSSSTSEVPAHILDSIEVSFEKMSEPERDVLREQLAEIQKKDWSKLSIKEKRAAYYVAFGPHGPRAPFPKYGIQVFFGTLGVCFSGALLYFGISSFAQPPPHTVTREWQEETNKYLLSQKANPITGISSEGYKGKGCITVD